MLDGVVDRLDKQVVRAGRELFKANALAEAQQSTVEAALEQLKNAEAHRERELAELRDRVGEARDAGRVDLVQRVLPALDGLEEAIGSGQRLMEREAARVNSVPSIWERLNPAGRRSRASEASSREAIAAWVAGLVFVRERLLDALAAVDVVPIIAEGRPFDPHRHVAVETVLASGTARPGAVVREHRRGYVRGSVILRYAEVVVARTEMEISR